MTDTAPVVETPVVAAPVVEVPAPSPDFTSYISPATYLVVDSIERIVDGEVVIVPAGETISELSGSTAIALLLGGHIRHIIPTEVEVEVEVEESTPETPTTIPETPQAVA